MSEAESESEAKTSRSITVWQAMALFFLILVIGVGLSWILQRQQHELAVQQHAINDANRVIAQQRYEGCLGGVATVERFNRQQHVLADIERELAADPTASDPARRAAVRRIKAYEDAVIPLAPNPCGERPR